MQALHFNNESEETDQVKQMRFLMIITTVVVFLGAIFMIVLCFARRCYACRHVAWIAEKQRKWIFWNGFIRTGL